MTFAAETKNELCAKEPAKSCCQIAELSALISFGAIIRGGKAASIKFSTENVSVSKRVFNLIKKIFAFRAQISIKKHKTLDLFNYRVYVQDNAAVQSVLEKLCLTSNDIAIRVPANLIGRDCCLRAYIRGAFLACGSIVDPNKAYHLEFVTDHYNLCTDFSNIFAAFEIEAKWTNRKSKYVIYFKDNQKILDILGIMGATTSVFYMHDVFALKEMRNNVNRVVNCENANIDKTVNASVEQIAAIRKIEQMGRLETLSKELQTIANLRTQNPDASLTELGQMLSISKSGASHRLRRIVSIAKELDL